MANTIHAKSGDTIKIIDNNDGDWVDVHQVYYVESVLDEDREQGSKCFSGIPLLYHVKPLHYPQKRLSIYVFFASLFS